MADSIITRAKTAACATFLVAAFLGGCGGKGWVDATDQRYKPGQRWAYNARPIDRMSTLLVVGVSRHPAHGTVINAEVGGLALYNPQTGGLGPGMVRVALTRSAFESSVTRLLREGEKLGPASVVSLDEWRRSGGLPDDRILVQVIDQFDNKLRSEVQR